VDVYVAGGGGGGGGGGGRKGEETCPMRTYGRCNPT